MIIRDVLPGEYPVAGELRVAAYRALGLLPEGSAYERTLRGLGFDGECTVLVACDEARGGILGTITLEPFGPWSELAQGETEAELRAFAVSPAAQGRGVGRQLLLTAIECAAGREVRRLRLCTQPAMKAAQHLYAAAGFSRTPELDFEPLPGVALRAYELTLSSLPFTTAVRGRRGGKRPDLRAAAVTPLARPVVVAGQGRVLTRMLTIINVDYPAWRRQES